MDKQIEMANLAQEQRQFDKQMMFELQKQTQDLAAKLTEMELKYREEIPGVDFVYDPATGRLENARG